MLLNVFAKQLTGSLCTRFKRHNPSQNHIKLKTPSTEHNQGDTGVRIRTNADFERGTAYAFWKKESISKVYCKEKMK